MSSQYYVAMAVFLTLSCKVIGAENDNGREGKDWLEKTHLYSATENSVRKKTFFEKVKETQEELKTLPRAQSTFPKYSFSAQGDEDSLSTIENIFKDGR